MAEHRLLQRHRPLGRRRRSGFFRVERPDQLWHMDMTSIWSAEHGWSYLNAIIDCCTREITAWSLDVRCRAQEAQAVLEQAVADSGIEPGTLVLGTDNGTAYTSRPFRARLTELGLTHRRGGRHRGQFRVRAVPGNAPTVRCGICVRDERRGGPGRQPVNLGMTTRRFAAAHDLNRRRSVAARVPPLNVTRAVNL